MKTQSISKQGLRDWLADVMSSQTLLAPKSVGGVYLFRPVDSVDEIAFDYDQSTVPPKEWFFPRTDVLFTVEQLEEGIALRPPLKAGPRVMFGIRPCDAQAMSILDHPYLMEPADQLYAERRNETTLVALACAKQQRLECFCTSLDGGPQDARFVDVLLAETADGYVVQAITDKGRALLAGASLQEGGEMPPAPQIANQVPTAGMAELLSRREIFNGEYWKRLADRCIGCKMCTFLCPTCHCFDVRDCQGANGIERLRCWDGCQSSHFTKLAGGHNPRGTKAARLRQFYAHKYLYFPERFGVTQCVGCGRCAHNCPVNIDIRETLNDLRKLEV